MNVAVWDAGSFLYKDCFQRFFYKPTLKPLSGSFPRKELHLFFIETLYAVCINWQTHYFKYFKFILHRFIPIEMFLDASLRHSCTLGIHQPDSGQVLVFGRIPGASGLRVPRAAVSFMLQVISLHSYFNAKGFSPSFLLEGVADKSGM